MSRISLVEVFRSVQGEGYNTGRAAVFVRFTGCNLACQFAEGVFCDTPYQQSNLTVDTVEALFRDHIMPLVRPGELRGVLDTTLRPENGPMLILTGGEPTLQPTFDQIVERARWAGFYVAVETNGTRYRDGLSRCHWVCVSPKESVGQGSPWPWHNPHPRSPCLDQHVVAYLEEHSCQASGEYRYVISSYADPVPPYLHAFRHYVSPGIKADGSGLEWKAGFPGFAPGALDRCLEIIHQDPRWRLSLQTHKIIQQR